MRPKIVWKEMPEKADRIAAPRDREKCLSAAYLRLTGSTQVDAAKAAGATLELRLDTQDRGPMTDRDRLHETLRRHLRERPPTAGRIQHTEIRHEDDCAYRRGQPCDCDPQIVSRSASKEAGR